MLIFLAPLSQPTLMSQNLQGLHGVKYTKYTKDDVSEQGLQSVSSDSAPRVCFCGVIPRYSSAPHLHERLVNAIRCANSSALVKLDRDRESSKEWGLSENSFLEATHDGWRKTKQDKCSQLSDNPTLKFLFCLLRNSASKIPYSF
jgi:hypothetical protein